MTGENSQEKYETEQVAIRLSRGIHDRMRTVKPRTATIGWVWSCAGRVFLTLPREVQLRIMQVAEEDDDGALLRIVTDYLVAHAAVADEQAAAEAAGLTSRRTGRRRAGAASKSPARRAL